MLLREKIRLMYLIFSKLTNISDKTTNLRPLRRALTRNVQSLHRRSFGTRAGRCLYGAISVDGKIFRVKTNVREAESASKYSLYSYQITELELLISGSESTSDALSGSNSISAAKLLNGVEKSYNPGVKLLDASQNSQHQLQTDQSTTSQTRFNSEAKQEKSDKTELATYTVAQCLKCAGVEYRIVTDEQAMQKNAPKQWKQIVSVLKL